VIPEEFETSIEIFARVLAHYNVPRSDIERLVDQIRSSHYEALRGGDGAGRLSLGDVAGIPQMAVERLRLPPDSPLVGKTLAAAGLGTQTGGRQRLSDERRVRGEPQALHRHLRDAGHIAQAQASGSVAAAQRFIVGRPDL